MSISDKLKAEQEAGRRALEKRSTTIRAAPTPNPNASNTPNPTAPAWTIDQLYDMGMDDLRALGKEHGVKARSKHDLVSELGTALGIMPAPENRTGPLENEQVSQEAVDEHEESEEAGEKPANPQDDEDDGLGLEGIDELLD